MLTLTTLLLTLGISTSVTAQTHIGQSCDPGAPFRAPAGRPRFELITMPTTTSGSNILPYSGLLLSAPPHNVSKLSNDQSTASIFKFHKKTGDIYFNIHDEASFHLLFSLSTRNRETNMGNFCHLQLDTRNSTVTPYSMHLYPGVLLGSGLPPYQESALALAPGWTNSDFSFDPVTNRVSPPCGRFSACALGGNATPYQLPEYELYWTDQAYPAGQCVDVEMKAVDAF